MAPASRPPAGAAPESGRGLPAGLGPTPSSAARAKPRASDRSHPDVAPGSTAGVPAAPALTNDSSPTAFSAVLGSLSKPLLADLDIPASRSESPTPVRQALPLMPGAEAATQGAVSLLQDGKPAPFVLEASISLPRPPDVTVEPALPAAQAATAASPNSASLSLSAASAALGMSATQPLPALVLQPSVPRRLPPGSTTEKQDRVPLAGYDAPAPPATSIVPAAASVLVAETAPSGIVDHPFELPKTGSSVEMPSGGNDAMRPVPAPHTLAFAARLVEQPASQAGPDEVRTPPTAPDATEAMRPISPPRSLAFEAPWVEAPANEAGPDGIRSASTETASAGGNDAMRRVPSPHANPLEARWVAPPVAEGVPADIRTPQTAVAAESETTPPLAVGLATQDAAVPAAPPAPTNVAPPAFQDALSSSPQTARPEHPDTPGNPPAEVQAPAVQREDADRLASSPRVVRRDNPLNFDKAGSSPALERDSAQHAAALETPPYRAPQAAAAPPAKADDPATAQLLSSMEPRHAAAPGPAHNISVRLSTDQNPAVEVRVMDRGGEVRVAVHSPDAATLESVRAGLPDLVARLGQRGYETETWHPPAGPSSSSNHDQRESGGAFGRGGQQEQPGGEQQRPPQRQQQPAWVEELEKNLNHTTNRSPFTWPPQSTR